MDHWPEVQEDGYGPLALKPWELGRLTPAEYQQMVKGYNRRAEEQRQELRWAVWYAAMLPYLEKPPQMQEFVGIAETAAAPAEQKSVEQLRSIMAEFAAAMSQGRG